MTKTQWRQLSTAATQLSHRILKRKIPIVPSISILLRETQNPFLSCKSGCHYLVLCLMLYLHMHQFSFPNIVVGLHFGLDSRTHLMVFSFNQKLVFSAILAGRSCPVVDYNFSTFKLHSFYSRHTCFIVSGTFNQVQMC